MYKTRFIRTALSLILAGFLVQCGPGVDPGSLNNVISETGQQYVPDSRLDVWDLQVKEGANGYVISGETTTAEGLTALKSNVQTHYPGADVGYAVTVLPDSTAEGNTHGVVRVSVAHARREPDQRSEMITQTVMGAPVKILKKRDGYYYCKMEDGYLGWVSTFSILAGDEQRLNRWKNSSLGVYNRVDGRIFHQQDRRSMPLSDIVLSSRVRILESGSEWSRVEMPDGRTGYLPTDHLLPMEQFQSATLGERDLVELARKMLGIPYTWGGTSTKGFDCSGFTQTIYKMNGVLLPRDANMQVEEGTGVDTSNQFTHLQPGDLLFFGRKPERITHVGMYIGDQEFIHSSGMVKINSLDPSAPNYSNYRHSSLQKVKRYF